MIDLNLNGDGPSKVIFLKERSRCPIPRMPVIPRLEWFQSPTHVGVTLFCKDRSESDVAVEYAASSVCADGERTGSGAEGPCARVCVNECTVCLMTCVFNDLCAR